MRIVHVITGLNDGGAEAVLFRLCTRDTENSHRVLSLMDLGKYGPLLEERGIEVTCLNMPRGRVRISGLWRLWRCLRRGKADAVQTWMYHADLLGGVTARVAGLRNINWGIHHTDLVSGESKGSTIAVAKICAQLSRSVPRHIICCAQRAKSVHAELGYDANRMHIIANGYDLSLFRPDPSAGSALRAALGIAPDAALVGFVARFDPDKDHDNLLLALARMSEWGTVPNCLLVGTGMEAGNAALVARIQELGLADRVRLLGRRSDIPAVMNALDLHVMSSRGEGFPNVLAESMACGTPCVTTDVGDAADIVDDTGWVVPPRDPSALADAIEEALCSRKDADAWQQRCSAARQRIEAKYSLDAMVAAYQEVWANASGWK